MHLHWLIRWFKTFNHNLQHYIDVMWFAVVLLSIWTVKKKTVFLYCTRGYYIGCSSWSLHFILIFTILSPVSICSFQWTLRNIVDNRAIENKDRIKMIAILNPSVHPHSKEYFLQYQQKCFVRFQFIYSHIYTETLKITLGIICIKRNKFRNVSK